jgi:hypothetical protein
MNYGAIFLLLLMCMTTGCGKLRDSDKSSCVASVTGETSGAEIGLRNSSQSTDTLIQSFSNGTATTISSVSLKLRKDGSPAGSVSIAIQGNTGSLPDGVEVTNASTSVALSTLTSGVAGFVKFSFTTAASLTASTVYWIVISATYPQNSTDYVSWYANTGNPYASGEAKVKTTQVGALNGTFISFGGSTSTDMVFKVGCD